MAGIHAHMMPIACPFVNACRPLVVRRIASIFTVPAIPRHCNTCLYLIEEFCKGNSPQITSAIPRRETPMGISPRAIAIEEWRNKSTYSGEDAM